MACLKKRQLATRPTNVGIQCNLMHLKYRVRRAFRPAMKRSILHNDMATGEASCINGLYSSILLFRGSGIGWFVKFLASIRLLVLIS